MLFLFEEILPQLHFYQGIIRYWPDLNLQFSVWFDPEAFQFLAWDKGLDSYNVGGVTVKLWFADLPKKTLYS